MPQPRFSKAYSNLPIRSPWAGLRSRDQNPLRENLRSYDGQHSHLPYPPSLIRQLLAFHWLAVRYPTLRRDRDFILKRLHQCRGVVPRRRFLPRTLDETKVFRVSRDGLFRQMRRELSLIKPRWYAQHGIKCGNYTSLLIAFSLPAGWTIARDGLLYHYHERDNQQPQIRPRASQSGYAPSFRELEAQALSLLKYQH